MDASLAVLLKKFVEDVDDPTALQDAVREGSHVLKELHEKLNTYLDDVPNLRYYAKKLEGLTTAQQPGTHIAVVGETGAGKSSLLNALLEEKNLLPTSGARACTAAVTVLAYNHSNDPERRYRCEIAFISKRAWSEQLRILLRDVLQVNHGKLTVCTKEKDAEVAYRQIKAVYPNLSDEQLATMKVDDLLECLELKDMLGTTAHQHTSSAKQMGGFLRKCIDSPRSSRTQPTAAWWPLVQEVRIFVKAHALSTGAILVDLPGVQDGNAARSSIASRYMLRCSQVWIVTECHRAGDKKTANDMLDERFGRQLKMDGHTGAVTYVCSKIDGVNIDGDLEESPGYSTMADNLAKLRRKKAENDVLLGRIEGQLEKYILDFEMAEGRLAQIEKVHATWLESKGKGNDNVAGSLTSIQKTSGGKRKKSRPAPSIKRRKLRGSSSVEDADACLCDDTANVDAPLGLALDKGHNFPWEREKNSAKAEMKTLKDRMTDLPKQLQKLRDDNSEATLNIHRLYIENLVDFCKWDIPNKFAERMEQIDQQDEANFDDEHYDPTEIKRDYEALKKSLPVFCISALADQRIRTRSNLGSVLPGFPSRRSTGIPRLQRHCRQVPKPDFKRILEQMSGFLDSLRIWMSGDEYALAKQQQAAGKAKLKECRDNLDGVSSRVVPSTTADVKTLIENHLLKHFPRDSEAAVRGSIAVVEGWHKQHRNGIAGSIHPNSYIAIVNRYGQHRGSRGNHDFNADLANEILKAISARWTHVCDRKIPESIEKFEEAMCNGLDTFYASLEQQGHFRHGSGASLPATAKEIFDGQKGVVRAGLSLILQQIQEARRSAISLILGRIRFHMRPAYELCHQESGKGCVKRMKQHIEDHLAKNNLKMYRSALNSMRKPMRAIADFLNESLLQLTRDITEHLDHDISAAFLGKYIYHKTPAEQKARGEVEDLLQLSQIMFSKLLETAKQETEKENLQEIKEKVKEGPGPHQQDPIVKIEENSGCCDADVNAAKKLLGNRTSAIARDEEIVEDDDDVEVLEISSAHIVRRSLSVESVKEEIAVEDETSTEFPLATSPAVKTE